MTALLKKPNFLFFVIAILISAYFVINMLILAIPSHSLPTIDYLILMQRYLNLSDGKINIIQYLLAKHIDHNHAMVYLLGLLDIMLDNGQLRLLHFVQIISHLCFYALILSIISKLNITLIAKSALILFISAQIFSLPNGETWFFPFQVVLSSFRLLFVGGILLFCTEVIKPHPSKKILLLAFTLLLIASLSHGSGILIFALCFFISAIWWNRHVVYLLLAFTALFILHEISFSGKTSTIELLTRIPIEEIIKVPLYLSFLLGNSLININFKEINVIVGASAIIFWIILTWQLLIKEKKENSKQYGYRLFFWALASFSLAAASTSILLNLSYMEIRGVETPPKLEYFLSSRYLITTSGFWIGMFALGILSKNNFSLLIRNIIAVVMIFSVTSSALLNFISLPKWEKALQRHERGEIIISNDIWSKLPDAQLNTLLFLPANFSASLPRLIISEQKKRNLGPYSERLVKKNRKKATSSPTNFSDANWINGVAINWAGIVTLNIIQNQQNLKAGNFIKFANGEVREILKYTESSIYLNIFLEGEPLNGNIVGYPNKFEVISK